MAPDRRRRGPSIRCSRERLARLRLGESMDLELQAQEAGSPRRRDLKERKCGVCNVEIEAFVVAAEQDGRRTVETIGRRQDRFHRTVRRDAHNRIERIGPAIEVAVHVECEVVAEDACGVRPGRAGRTVGPHANGDHRALRRIRDVELAFEQLQSVRPR